MQALKKFLTMISPKHSIAATIEDNVIDIIYVGELEIHTLVTHHCVTYSVWPGPLLIVLHFALNAQPQHLAYLYHERMPAHYIPLAYGTGVFDTMQNLPHVRKRLLNALQRI